MSIRALRTLVAILDAGSFQGASERLHLTLSAVSMQVRGLEADFGVALFDRAFRPPRLTGEGAALAAAAREIVSRYDDLPALARGGAPLVGDVALGVTGTVSVRLLPGFLARFVAQQPQARLSVETGVSELLVAKVAAGQLDAAIVTGTSDAGRRVSVDLVREEPLVVVAPRGLAAAGTARDLLRTNPYIRFRPDTGIGKLAERYLDRAGIAPRVLVTLDGVEAIVECVAAGLGVTVLPGPDARRYGGERVACLPIPDPPLTRAIALVTRPRPSAQGLRRALHGLLMAGEEDSGADR